MLLFHRGEWLARDLTYRAAPADHRAGVAEVKRVRRRPPLCGLQMSAPDRSSCVGGAAPDLCID